MYLSATNDLVSMMSPTLVQFCVCRLSLKTPRRACIPFLYDLESNDDRRKERREV